MSPPCKLAKTDEGEKKKAPDGVIRMEIGNIMAMGADPDDPYSRWSPYVEIGGVRWELCVHQNFYDESLTATVLCEKKQLSPWRVNVDAEYTLVHSDPSKNITANESKSLDGKPVPYGDGAILLDWKEIVDNVKGFVTDGKITVECRFWITSKKGIKIFPHIDFTDANDSRHDVAFVIDGEKIYANKGILSIHSPVLSVMFNGDFVEKGKNEIELKDINREHFIEMLNVIYPLNKEITFESAKYLVGLGKQFLVESVVDRAEKVLVDNWKAKADNNMEMLILADKYEMFGLLEDWVSSFNTTEKFKEIEKSSFYKDLSVETKLRLFARVIEIAQNLEAAK